MTDMEKYHQKNKRRSPRQCRGFTLIDVMIAMLILLIISLGILTYRYTAALNILKAKEHLTAADLAATLIETWQGVNGSETFDPETTLSTDLSISSGTGQDEPAGYTLLGKYDIQDDNKTYQLTLSWKDIDASLRELNVIITWLYLNETNQKTYQLTTYVTRS